ncbi:restriction endonuclease [Brevundimonas sp. LPMIX5]|uniref:restriction endonuclease PLD domain-containing protein n=1 Tax=Brevundimonas sp. LPMIX5 TaxID=2305887 RepID=UPI000E66D2F4|nr:phospholipase D family protein [Brevundimonas sp. LPMIX5]RIJ65906.1 restriction endonuclease [Brevundimonas sp. LPMIX5]
MPTIRLIKPRDQATGKNRLLHELKADLADPGFEDLKIVVAYAKSGPILRLQQAFAALRGRGGKIEAIIGIDQQGTSRQALELGLALFDATYVTQERGITFHPKAYIFSGSEKVRMYIGSSNLTVGGTETNFEASAVVDLDPATEGATVNELMELWTDLLPVNCPATRKLDLAALNSLTAQGFVLPEREVQQRTGKAKKGTPLVPKSGLLLQPPTPLPKSAMKPGQPTPGIATKRGTASAPTGTAVAGIAMQITPHHNGEIFLSKMAANENPSFFAFPFKGVTVPKTATGKPYPQRLPDPVVNIDVYGAMGALTLSLASYSLNTVFYSPKSEIRVTASPLVPKVPPYSIMVMRPGATEGVDYDIEIHTPDSPEYPKWRSVCTTAMPGGGKPPRWYGWF